VVNYRLLDVKMGKIFSGKSTKSDSDSIDYFLLTNDYFCCTFRPKAMVVENKNRKFEKIFYFISYKHLR